MVKVEKWLLGVRMGKRRGAAVRGSLELEQLWPSLW
jgi:hypothetical protein